MRVVFPSGSESAGRPKPPPRPRTLAGRIWAGIRSLFVDHERQQKEFRHYLLLCREFAKCHAAEERMEVLDEAIRCGVPWRIVDEALSASCPLMGAEQLAFELYRACYLDAAEAEAELR